MTSYEELARSFVARQLAVPMTSAITLSPDVRALDAARILSAENFDQAPVMDGGRVTGFVLTRDLEETHRRQTVADVTRAIGVGNIVSADAPVASLLQWILEPGLLFVVDGLDIFGFVTVFDFNKQPSRAYLYLLLAALEIELANVIRSTAGSDQDPILERLAAQDRRDIRARIDRDREANLEGDVVSYLQFRQLLRVANADPCIRPLLELDWASLPEWANELCALRNEVMHPVRTLVSGKGGLIRVAHLEHLARELLGRFGDRSVLP